MQGEGGTLTAFQPAKMHATTERGGVISYGLAMNATRRVGDAIKELNERGQTLRYGLDIDIQTIFGYKYT